MLSASRRAEAVSTGAKCVINGARFEMNHFTLTIHTRTGHFGETSAAERAGIAQLLHQAAQEIGSGRAPSPLKDGGGHVVGHYEFGPGMICGPGPGFDETHWKVPSVLNGGAIAPAAAS
jgi:hypothetical protein